MRTPFGAAGVGVVRQLGELDGRNRYTACQQVGIEPATVVYDGADLAEYVIDANVTRRNMSTGARAMATAMVLAAADGRRENGRWEYGSLSQSGESAVSDWPRRLREAGIVLDYAPDLAEQVRDGDLTLHAAYTQADENRRSARGRA